MSFNSKNYKESWCVAAQANSRLDQAKALGLAAHGQNFNRVQKAKLLAKFCARSARGGNPL